MSLLQKDNNAVNNLLGRSEPSHDPKTNIHLVLKLNIIVNMYGM
jgi:hypothetical protein